MTLEDLKRHPFYPFRDFAKEDLAFLMLELYWAELFRETLAEAGDSARISEWVPATAPDRADANPILHLVNRSMQPIRALRVIQRYNTERLPELDLENPKPVQFTGDAYVPFVPGLTYNALDQDGETPMDELVISSDISEPCEKLNRAYVKQWCVERVSPQTAQNVLDQYWRAVRANLIETNANG